MQTATTQPPVIASERAENDRRRFSCAECDAVSDATLLNRSDVVACHRCGQCLDAPVEFAMTGWGLTRPHWPFPHEKMSARAEILIAIFVGALGYVSLLPVYAQVAASFLGTGLFLEGLGRIKRVRREAVQFRWEDRPDLTRFGPIKAVYLTRNSLLDCFAIGCMVVVLGCGVAWILDVMSDHAGMDVNRAKGWLCLALVPSVMAYCAYRAVRLTLDRRTLFLHAEGIRVEKRADTASFRWDDLRVVTAVHLGDAIDEDAIDFEFNTSRRKLRITRAQFPQIEQIWVRVLQEAEEQIQLARLEVRSEVHRRAATA